jgi:hypothetical protein
MTKRLFFDEHFDKIKEGVVDLEFSEFHEKLNFLMKLTNTTNSALSLNIKFAPGGASCSQKSGLH